jgi:hypothetical protein
MTDWYKISILVKSFEVKWIRYLAYGRLSKDAEEQWIGFSHKPDAKIFKEILFLGTPETKIPQQVYIKNIKNVWEEK